MKTIGRRTEPPITLHASGALLAAGARFNETLSHLSPSTFVPKGVYRFRTHEAANLHWQDCLARGMAAHGYQRATTDIDVLVPATVEAGRKLKQAAHGAARSGRKRPRTRVVR